MIREQILFQTYVPECSKKTGYRKIPSNAFGSHRQLDPKTYPDSDSRLPVKPNVISTMIGLSIISKNLKKLSETAPDFFF